MKIDDNTRVAMRRELLARGKGYWVLYLHRGWWYPAKDLVGDDWFAADLAFVQAVAGRLCEDGYKAEAVA